MKVTLTWNRHLEKWMLKSAETGAFLMDLPDCANARKLFGVSEDREPKTGFLKFEEAA